MSVRALGAVGRALDDQGRQLMTPIPLHPLKLMVDCIPASSGATPLFQVVGQYLSLKQVDRKRGVGSG